MKCIEMPRFSQLNQHQLTWLSHAKFPEFSQVLGPSPAAEALPTAFPSDKRIAPPRGTLGRDWSCGISI